MLTLLPPPLHPTGSHPAALSALLTAVVVPLDALHCTPCTPCTPPCCAAVDVRHCLLALPGVEKGAIKRVLSHPQALAQTDSYTRRMPGVVREAVDDTGGWLGGAACLLWGWMAVDGNGWVDGCGIGGGVIVNERTVLGLCGRQNRAEQAG